MNVITVLCAPFVTEGHGRASRAVRPLGVPRLASETWVLLPLVALVLMALSGCKTIPPAKPLEQLTPQEHAGYVAFQQNCATCHYDRDTGALHGPSLLGVFRNQYLPSGAPANDDRVTNVMLRGRGMMPTMRGQLGQDDVADILAYLKTL